MMETILAFGMGVLMSEWVLGILFIGILILDFNEQKFWSGALSVIVLVGIYLICKSSIETLTWQMLAVGVSSYIAAGFLWSLFKLNRYGNKLVRKFNESAKSSSHPDIAYEHLRDKLSLTRNVERIAYWFAFWPVSFLGFVIHDALNWFITDVVGEMYEWATSLALSNAVIPKDKTDG